MNSKKKRRGQMSEAFCTAMFLSLSGGLQDVYTYPVSYTHLTLPTTERV